MRKAVLGRRGEGMLGREAVIGAPDVVGKLFCEIAREVAAGCRGTAQKASAVDVKDELVFGVFGAGEKFACKRCGKLPYRNAFGRFQDAFPDAAGGVVGPMVFVKVALPLQDEAEGGIVHFTHKMCS